MVRLVALALSEEPLELVEPLSDSLGRRAENDSATVVALDLRAFEAPVVSSSASLYAIHEHFNDAHFRAAQVEPVPALVFGLALLLRDAFRLEALWIAIRRMASLIAVAFGEKTLELVQPVRYRLSRRITSVRCTAMSGTKGRLTLAEDLKNVPPQLKASIFVPLNSLSMP